MIMPSQPRSSGESRLSFIKKNPASFLSGTLWENVGKFLTIGSQAFRLMTAGPVDHCITCFVSHPLKRIIDRERAGACPFKRQLIRVCKWQSFYHSAEKGSLQLASEIC